MSRPENAGANRPWHAMLAPLPNDAVLRRKPVGSPEVLATPNGAAIAGWEQLSVELSAGSAGLRIVLVVLDGRGQPISASDAVLYRVESQATGPTNESAHMIQDSIGGRIEPDGSFRGTCWRTEGPEPAEGEEPRWELTRSEPTPGQVDALMTLVADIVRRGLRSTR